jgi:hypothetical protein
MPTQREDTASVAALVVFVLLGLTGLAGTPRVETDRMFPLLVAAQEEITPCPWFHR